LRNCPKIKKFTFDGLTKSDIQKMKTEVINIEKGQYLSDIMDFIPANAIVEKTLPGIGATFCEITSKRNSIIIEPNVPVIEGKRLKHPNILGVIEGVTIQDLKDYLKSEVEFKKIICTPESYFKVQKAFKQLSINYFDEYFFLFDECERITQDIDYRETIHSPMEDFWKFKNRSFISATPREPSAKEFEMNGFKHILIKPNFDFMQDVNLMFTPNVLATFKHSFYQSIPDTTNIKDCHCFFINSVDMIHCIIKELKINEVSNIYCSTTAVKKLNKLQCENAFSTLVPLNSINFFTGRFFSAVDIECDFKPHITIVSDIKFAPHTKIHPLSEFVQIVGRFRNGVQSVTLITNTDNNLPYKSIEDVYKNIEEGKKAYDQLYTLYEEAPNENYRTVIKEALDRVEIAKYIMADGRLNRFMIDNKISEQFLKNIYREDHELAEFYFFSGLYNTREFDYSGFKFKDNRFFYRAQSTKKRLRQDIVNQLENIDLSFPEGSVSELSRLEREDSLIVSAFVNLGMDFIESVNYNEIKLWVALVKKAVEKGETLHPLMDAILGTFKVSWDYTEKEIKEKLTVIYYEFEIEGTPSATDLEKYFVLSPRKTIWGRKGTDGKNPKGCKILSAKFKERKLGTIFNLG